MDIELPKYEKLTANQYGSVENTESIETKDGPTFTVHEAIEHTGSGRFQVKLVIAAGLLLMSDSMELIVLGILGPVLKCEWNITTFEESMLSTSVFVGLAVGAPLTGWLCDKFSRRNTLIIAALWTAAFGLLSASASSYAWLLLCRCMTGVGISGGFQGCTYCSEFLPNGSRGRWLMSMLIFFGLGYIVEVSLAILVLLNFGWRLWLVSSALPLFLAAFSLMFLPKSPQFLVACGELQRAEETLLQMANTNKTTLPPGHLQPEQEVPRANFMDLLRSVYRRSTLHLWLIWFVVSCSLYGATLLTSEFIQRGTTCVRAEQFSPAVVANGTVPEACHVMDIGDYVTMLWTSLAEPTGTAITITYIDKVGRRFTLPFNFLVYSGVMFLLLVCVNSTYLVALVLVSRVTVISAFQTTYVYVAELYPAAFRGCGLGSCSLMARVGGMLAPVMSQLLLDQSMTGTVVLYAFLGLLAAVVAALLPIETWSK